VFGKRLFRAKTGRAKLPLSRFYTVWRLGGSLALPGFRVSKHALSPACNRMLLSVPGAKSSDGWPGTVT